MCGEGEAAGEQSAVDHTQNSLFSAEKDTLRSAVGQLKYSRGSESNTQDEYFFFLTKTRCGLAVGAASQKEKVAGMRLHTYVGRKATAKSRSPAGKGDTGKPEIRSEKMSCSCQDQNCLAGMPGDFHMEDARFSKAPAELCAVFAQHF